jgi:hypothetical protein
MNNARYVYNKALQSLGLTGNETYKQLVAKNWRWVCSYKIVNAQMVLNRANSYLFPPDSLKDDTDTYCVFCGTRILAYEVNTQRFKYVRFSDFIDYYVPTIDKPAKT